MGWDETIGATQLWTAIGQLGAELNDYETQSPGNEHVRRVRALNNAARARLLAIDPDFIVPAHLDDFYEVAVRVQTVLRSHFAPAEGVAPTSLVDVEAATIDFASELNVLPTPIGVLAPDAAAVVEELRSEVQSAVDRAHRSTDALEERIGQLSSDVANIEADNIGTLRAEIDALAQMVRDASDRMESETVAALQLQTSAAQSELDAIEGLRNRAKDLLGEIGRVGLTEGYSQWEADEISAADKWRGLAVRYGLVAAVAVVGLVVLHTWVDPAGDSDWAAAIASLTVPAAFGTIARYCSRQSTHHRRNAVLARRTALELASLGAYVEPLGQTERDALTIKLVSAYFGRAMMQAAPADEDMENFLTGLMQARRERADLPADE